jgi:hypothetical protein
MAVLTPERAQDPPGVQGVDGVGAGPGWNRDVRQVPAGGRRRVLGWGEQERHGGSKGQ